MDNINLIELVETGATPLITWVLVYFTLLRSLRKDIERIEERIKELKD